MIKLTNLTELLQILENKSYVVYYSLLVIPTSIPLGEFCVVHFTGDGVTHVKLQIYDQMFQLLIIFPPSSPVHVGLADGGQMCVYTGSDSDKAKV